MGFISWIIIGGLAGWIASKIMHVDDKMGKLANILAGFVGGTLANYILLTFFGVKGLDGFGLQSLITSIIGAVIVIGLVKAIRR